MVIGILAGIAVLCFVASFFGETFKKVLETISLIAKLCVGGAVSMLVYEALGLDFEKTWVMLAFIVGGAALITALTMLLASFFRLVGYSINFFINSFIVLLIIELLGDKVSVSFITYAAILLLFPRVMWISDRRSTSAEYSHSSYNFFSGVTTRHYEEKDVDLWEDSGEAWGCIPLQIVIACVFYAIGSVTLLSVCPINATWLMVLYILVATAVNVLFDFFVLRYIEEEFF